MLSNKAEAAPLLPGGFRHVHLVLKQRPCLVDMTFTLHPGAPTFVLGANGAGKTLTLQVAHGLFPVERGAVTWHPRRLGAQGGAVHRRQALVFQHPVMLRRSVAANIAYGLRLRGWSRAAWQERVAELLSVCGLEALRDRLAPDLSTGQKQRLALARAWAWYPELLFLDEPTANLDPQATGEIEAILRQIVVHGTKIVMSSHDLRQTRRLAGEIIFLHQGRVCEITPAARFFSRPQSPEAVAFLSEKLLA